MITTFTTHGIQQLTLLFKVGDVLKTVVFTVPVVYGNMGKACYTTSDRELIDAMKAHNMFNVNYFVKEEIGDTDSDATSDNVKTIEDELRDPANPIIVESVTTKGMAAAYIQGMYGESFTATSVEEMKREAARKWNILFPKWGK